MAPMNTTPRAGTRLRCATCGTEIVVVKPATGPLACCGEPMTALGGEVGGDGQPAR